MPKSCGTDAPAPYTTSGRDQLGVLKTDNTVLSTYTVSVYTSGPPIKNTTNGTTNATSDASGVARSTGVPPYIVAIYTVIVIGSICASYCLCGLGYYCLVVRPKKLSTAEEKMQGNPVSQTGKD